MQRIYNHKLKKEVLFILPGEYYISNESETISTLLGSCISVCLYEQIKGLGGMNHFLLPQKLISSKDIKLDRKNIHNSFESTRYGITAMEVLILEMQKKGAKRENLRAKVFGGGEVIIRYNNTESVGKKNIDVIKSYLKMEKIPIDLENTGNKIGRKIHFNTEDNSVLMEEITMESVKESELPYIDNLKNLQLPKKIIYF
jgi:chemotaxis protein CheD